MNFKKLGLSLLTGVALCSSLVSPALASAEGLKLGANYELSGAAASYGTPMSKGTKLALKQANEAGGLLGEEVELVEYDNKSDLTESATVATRLINEGVQAIVGPAPSGDILAQAPVVEQGEVPAVAPAGTLDGLTKDNDGNVLQYLFRVCFEDSFQGRVGATYVADNLGLKKAALLVDQAVDYSQGVAKAFQAEFESRGGEVVVSESFTSGDTDFSAVLTTVLASEAEVLYVPAYYTEVGLLIKQAREMGLTMPIVGADGMHSQTLVELAGPENMYDVYYTTHYSEASEDPAVQEFQAAYKEAYGEDPDTFSALAYDATKLIFDATERAGSNDPKAIRDALAETKEFKGVTGTFSMGEDNTPIKTVVMLRMNDQGKVESAEEISAE